VDLGSGGGIDCLIAARAVGPTGSVIGVDFLPDMVGRATHVAAEAGLGNMRFVEGEMEELPLADDSVEVVISNGVINLSPRKVRVLAEAFGFSAPAAGWNRRPGPRARPAARDPDPPRRLGRLPVGALAEIAMYKGLRRAGFREAALEPRATREPGVRALPALQRRAARRASGASPTRAARPHRDEHVRRRLEAGPALGPARPGPCGGDSRREYADLLVTSSLADNPPGRTAS
jgi:SAM-dependent methyltransferase